MGLYLYGVTSGETVPRELTGIDQASVQLLGDGDLRLIVSRLERPVTDLQESDPEETIAAVRHHDDVLTAISAVAPVLPVRFGAVLPDRRAADELLQDPDGTLASRLSAVAGADEWVVQVDAPAPAEPADDEVADLTPGHAFFERKRSQADARQHARERAHALAEELEHHLRGLVRQARRLAPRDPQTVSRAAYLVDRDVVDRFLAVINAAEDVTVSVQGPLPPYRFADEAETADGTIP